MHMCAKKKCVFYAQWDVFLQSEKIREIKIGPGCRQGICFAFLIQRKVHYTFKNILMSTFAV